MAVTIQECILTASTHIFLPYIHNCPSLYIQHRGNTLYVVDGQECQEAEIQQFECYSKYIFHLRILSSNNTYLKFHIILDFNCGRTGMQHVQCILNSIWLWPAAIPIRFDPQAAQNAETTRQKRTKKMCILQKKMSLIGSKMRNRFVRYALKTELVPHLVFYWLQNAKNEIHKSDGMLNKKFE